MLKICVSAIVDSLSITFSSGINQRTFPDIWKKLIITKKVLNKISIYRSVSLLSIFRKIFEGSNEYVKKKKLLSAHQSGFWSNNFCVSQLLSIVYNFYKAFDIYLTLKTRSKFWDMPFDKIWCKELIFKLKSIRVPGSLLNSFGGFLNNRPQRLLLHWQISEWPSTRIYTWSNFARIMLMTCQMIYY